MLTKSSDMLSKNTWGVKKVRGQEEPANKSSDIKWGQEVCEWFSDLKIWYHLEPRSLYLANYLLLSITFTSKAHNNLQGVFPTMIGFVTLATFFAWYPKQKVAKGDKASHGWENTL